MNCKQFQKLTPIEKSTYIGKLVHCVTNSSFLFKEGEALIKEGERRRLFDGVIINPEVQPVDAPCES